MIEKKAIHQRSDHLWESRGQWILMHSNEVFKERGKPKSKAIKNKNNKNAYV